ncbi:MAG: 6-bladed beta-propeller [Bacteroidales bacterium]|jgi:hypothetical protein|nr:6-bladed beta-propeller [Bacteroidales bacterium]
MYNLLLRKYIYIVLLVIFFESCNSDKKENDHHCEYAISIRIDNISELNMNDIATLDAIIPLETSDEVLIGKIERVFLTDSLIIVWDSKVNEIIVYDYQGHYKQKIGHKGIGPGEYGHISDVYLDESKRIISFSDIVNRRIYNYDFQGTLISSHNVKYHLYSFIPYNGGYWGINTGQNPDNYDLIYINENSDITRGYFPISTAKAHLILTNNFSLINDGFLFHRPYSDIIYKIKGEEVKPYIHIDFGKSGIAYKNIKPEQLFNVVENTDYIGKLQHVYLDGDNLFFSFGEYSGNNIINSYHCYTSLNHINPVIYTYKIKHNKRIIVDPLPEILNASRSTLIFQLNPNILPEVVLDRFKNTEYEQVITAESNPVLILYKLKNNEN